ncbi:MAG: hypothetical protein GWN58_41165 [Anaerolineae bacterium]|nr:hypothetical protein [Anaerolineae bacterium]
MKKETLWIVVLGILTLGLVAGPGLWAAPGQSPARQTVPTRTPTASPPTETPTPRPTSEPRPTSTALTPTATPSENIPATGSSSPLLPEAGGRSIRLRLGWVLIALGLLVLATGGRRVLGTWLT